MSVITDCLDDLTDYEVDLCGNDLIPGISAFALVDLDHTISAWDNATQWQTNITAKNAWIIRDGKGNYPTPSPVMVDNPRANGSAQKLQKMDHTFTFEDPNVNDINDTFWKTVNGRNMYLVWYNFEEQQIRVVDDYKVTIVALPAKDDSGSNFQTYMITCTWQTKPDGFPTLYTAPTGIFE